MIFGPIACFRRSESRFSGQNGPRSSDLTFYLEITGYIKNHQKFKFLFWSRESEKMIFTNFSEKFTKNGLEIRNHEWDDDYGISSDPAVTEISSDPAVYGAVFGGVPITSDTTVPGSLEWDDDSERLTSALLGCCHTLSERSRLPFRREALDWTNASLRKGSRLLSENVSVVSLEIPRSPSSHSRFPDFRRLTRDSRNRRLTRDFLSRPKIVFFYRKTGNFHRKNDQGKISDIFVHLAPENTGKTRFQKKVARKNHFHLFPAVSEAN